MTAPVTAPATLSAADAVSLPGSAGRTAGRTAIRAAGPDLDRLAEYAELYASVADAAALLEIGEASLRQLLDDAETPAARLWRRGRARARIAVRRAQFGLMEKNATLAIHLGRELLGQDGGGAAGPMTFVVDTGIRRDG